MRPCRDGGNAMRDRLVQAGRSDHSAGPTWRALPASLGRGAPKPRRTVRQRQLRVAGEKRYFASPAPAGAARARAEALDSARRGPGGGTRRGARPEFRRSLRRTGRPTPAPLARGPGLLPDALHGHQERRLSVRGSGNQHPGKTAAKAGIFSISMNIPAGLDVSPECASRPCLLGRG